MNENKLGQIREVLIEAMLDAELHDQAGEHKGALVSLTDEYRDDLTKAFGAVFDDAVSARVAAAVAAERERIAVAIEADARCSCTDSYCAQRSMAKRAARIARSAS